MSTWEVFLLSNCLRLAEKKENKVISRTELLRELPAIEELLKRHLGFKVGQTPESTMDKTIQDLGRKGFLEMLHMKGRRGEYQINVSRIKEFLNS